MALGEWVGHMPEQVYKIIASTNSSLNLPAIPEWFIKEYAEKQTSEILVEEKTTITGTMIDPNQGHQYGFPKLYCGINPSPSEIKDFIAENGYPMEEYINCRCWEVEVKQLDLYPVKKAWTRDEIEFVLYYTSGIGTVAAAKVLEVLDDVEQDMREFEEDQRADAYKREFDDRNW